jgi:DNA polymerase III alpha subunit
MMPTAKANEELSRRTDRPLPSDAHRTRRQTELEWVRHHGWAPELLSAHDSVVALRKTGGEIGPPMGSTGASLLLWCLGLTDADPVEWDFAPSLFYRASAEAAQRCRWYASAQGTNGNDRFDADPLVDSIDNLLGFTLPLQQGSNSDDRASRRVAAQWIKDIHESGNVPRASWEGTTDIPSSKEVLFHRHNRGFYDLLCALALARPGPVACGMLDEYLVTDEPPGLPPILAISLGVPIFREQLHWLGASLLDLNIDETNAFVRRVQEQPEGDWATRIRAKLLDRGLNREWVHRFCDQVGRWSIYLFPLSHALGRARLISATISTTNEDAQQ